MPDSFIRISVHDIFHCKEVSGHTALQFIYRHFVYRLFMDQLSGISITDGTRVSERI